MPRVTVSRKTLERYTDLAKKHLAAHLGGHRLQKLAPLHIQAAYSKMLASGRLSGAGGLAPQTVHHAHRLLFSALRQAVRWQLLTSNPAEAVTPPSPASREIAVLDDGEIGTLLMASRKTRLYAPIMVAVTTGLRRGEVLGLRWSDMTSKAGASPSTRRSSRRAKA